LLVGICIGKNTPNTSEIHVVRGKILRDAFWATRSGKRLKFFFAPKIRVQRNGDAFKVENLLEVALIMPLFVRRAVYNF